LRLLEMFEDFGTDNQVDDHTFLDQRFEPGGPKQKIRQRISLLRLLNGRLMHVHPQDTMTQAGQGIGHMITRTAPEIEN
jgi:hypothetical protein